jgi:hypothetical protein
MTIPGEPVRTRVGTAVRGASPIVGIWTYEHHTRSTAYERYEADGTCQLRIPMPGEWRGKWMVANGKLTTETNGGTVRSFEISEDQLTISDNDAGRSRILRRTPAWYPYPLAAAEVEKLRERVLRGR